MERKRKKKQAILLHYPVHAITTMGTYDVGASPKDSHGKKKEKEASNAFALPSACNHNYGHI
jgi:hypothetical protein